MAKKLFGKKKKKAAAATDPAAPSQPIITSLDLLPANSPLRNRTSRMKGPAPAMSTILGYDPRISGKLGQ